MSPSVALFQVPRGGFNKSLKEAAQLYPSGYAGRFIWGGKSWLMCASGNYLAYPKYFSQFKQALQGIAICQLQGRIFIHAWDKTGVIVCFLGNQEKVSALISILLSRDGFSPQIWLDSPSELSISEKLTHLPQQQLHAWPALTEKERQTLKMYSMKRLSSKPWLGLVSVISFAVFISYGLNAWAPWRNNTEWHDPSIEFAAQLASVGADIIPLLRQDYNLQLTLQQLVGWRLERVEYTRQSVRYRLRRESGSLQSMRAYARQYGFVLRLSEGYAQLTQALQLPSAIAEPTSMQWHTVSELTDWLDLQLGLWLPTSKLKLGKLERVAKWQQQQITIELRDYYLPDLLTLAGILDGLPLQLTQGVLHVQSNLISGKITMQAIGALG